MPLSEKKKMTIYMRMGKRLYQTINYLVRTSMVQHFSNMLLGAVLKPDLIHNQRVIKHPFCMKLLQQKPKPEDKTASLCSLSYKKAGQQFAKTRRL